MIYDILVRLKRAFIPLLVAVVGAVAVPNHALAAPGGIPGKPDSNSPFSAIYVIGDSLSDTGRTSSVLTTPLFTFPPPPFAPGRMSNGSLWIEQFAPMVRLNYNPLDNLAWAGALTGATLIPQPPSLPTINNIYGPLPGMTNQAIELRDLSNSILDPRALYVVFGASNDFLRISPAENNAGAVIGTAVENLFAIVDSLHLWGARNIVVVNVPDLGRIPKNLRQGAAIASLATQYSAAFNSSLDTRLNRLNFETCRVSLFDLSRDFSDKPKKYGFTNVTDPSFPDVNKGQTYLFWDDVHPTTLAHGYLAGEVFQAVAKAGMLSRKPN